MNEIAVFSLNNCLWPETTNNIITMTAKFRIKCTTQLATLFYYSKTLFKYPQVIYLK